MSGLLGATTALLYPKHGRCGVDLHDKDEEVSDGCTTNSGNNTRGRNNNKINETTTTTKTTEVMMKGVITNTPLTP
jgi:hypothetical protein